MGIDGALFPNVFDDLAVAELQQRHSCEEDLAPGTGWDRSPVGQLSERFTRMGSAAFPAAYHIIAGREKLIGGPELQVGQRLSKRCQHLDDGLGAMKLTVHRVSPQ